MQTALVLGALAAGVAASPHCAAMCGAPCAALTGGCAKRSMAFHAGRVASYATAGAVVAGSVALLAQWSALAPLWRPVWVAVQLGFLALGLAWLIRGRQPRMLRQAGAVPVQWVGRRGGAARAGIAGAAWVAWPCGALQGALVLAALADSPGGGALVMGSYAMASAPALAAAPWAWARLRRWANRPSEESGAAWAHRLAGAMLVISSGWALTHGVWERMAAWCAAA